MVVEGDGMAFCTFISALLLVPTRKGQEGKIESSNWLMERKVVVELARESGFFGRRIFLIYLL